jgi:hypothetical protein
MNRNLANLFNTTAIATGLLDANGAPIPVRTLDLTTLPLIERRALPGLPEDIEARLMGGAEPVIVLCHPVSDLHIEMPLLDRRNVAKYAAAIHAAVERQATGAFGRAFIKTRPRLSSCRATVGEIR